VTRLQTTATLGLGLAVLLAAAEPAAAGEPLGTNLFGGYSYLHISEDSRHGANLALDFRAFGPVAGSVDLSSHWGSESGTGLNDLTLMAGPGLRFGSRWGTSFFVRALAGLVRDRASIDVLDVSISESSTNFGWMAGGGVDLRVARKVAARVQADYMWQQTTEGPPPTPAGTVGEPTSGHASGFRVSAGVVYRLGTAP
jgi:opacity protein-like surface antigen